MDPTIGRLTQSDPAITDANNYAYCGDDPVNRTDPMGTDWSWTSGSGSNYAWVWVPSTWGGSKVQETPPPGVHRPAFTPDSSLWGQTLASVVCRGVEEPPDDPDDHRHRRLSRAVECQSRRSDDRSTPDLRIGGKDIRPTGATGYVQ